MAKRMTGSVPCCKIPVRLNDGQRLIRCKRCSKVWNTYTAKGTTHFEESDYA